jgi:predicted ATPase
MHRKGLAEQLLSLCSREENVLLVGPAGIGKTTLLKEISLDAPLLVCEETSSLGRICDCLEQKLGRRQGKSSIIQRKNRLLNYLEQRHEAVAFDQMAETPPRVARFIAHLIQKVPVWVVCRSDQRREIGRLWEYLYNFTRVEVPPLSFVEASALIRSAVDCGRIQADARKYDVELYRISKGVPGTLEGLLTELAARNYKMNTAFGLRLLELDRQIREAAMATAKLPR